MRIPNPFPRDKYVRYTCKPSGCGGHTCSCEELDVPEGTKEVLIESVDRPGPKASYVFASRIWSKWGSLCLEDHLKKMHIEEEEKKLAENKAKLIKRKDREVTCGPKILLNEEE